MVKSITSDYSRQGEALRAQLDKRDKSLRRASSDIRGMSSSLARLKRDVASLRAALGRLVKVLGAAVTAPIRSSLLDSPRERFL